MKRTLRGALGIVWLASAGWSSAWAGALVLQTDFGTADGAVAAMKGVAVQVDPRLPIFDLTHEIPAYDIWSAAYRLKQTVSYWPAGTVFVSVVDPGVGTERRSVVLKTRSGHLVVTPDNGTLTLLAEDLGIEAVRAIDETVNRLAGSEKSHTFHGRDVFAYTGARLAAGVISFEDVGPVVDGDIVRLAHEKARRDGMAVVGGIPALDVRYGNVWTDIGDTLFAELKPAFGDRFRVVIAKEGREVYAGEMPYAHSFGDVAESEPLLYLNSLLNVSLALNMRSFAAAHGIEAGGAWSVRIEKIAR
ncbi:MAG: S-adenosyl-l-methionine hydroxide adenosyltransferase family protein [Opitutaceae bacterium]|nr:S-adenosyl-l-methionine hydroxide adenosyltransferase family protein [Opitutaceae bacterium]